jgi:hypothetical protein
MVEFVTSSESELLLFLHEVDDLLTVERKLKLKTLALTNDSRLVAVMHEYKLTQSKEELLNTVDTLLSLC